MTGQHVAGRGSCAVNTWSKVRAAATRALSGANAPGATRSHLARIVFMNEQWSMGSETTVLAAICAETITIGTRTPSRV